MACLNTEGVEANFEGLPEPSPLENKHFVSAVNIPLGIDSEGVCETTWLTVWGEEDSLLNNVKGPFQSTQGSGWGPKPMLSETTTLREVQAAECSQQLWGTQVGLMCSRKQCCSAPGGRQC